MSADPAQPLHAVIDRLLRDGTAVARSDGSTHDLFPIGIPAAEGEALRDAHIQRFQRASVRLLRRILVAA